MAENNLHLALYIFETLYSRGPLPLNLVTEIYQFKVYPNQIIPRDILLNEMILFLKQYPSLFQTDSEYVFPVSNEASCQSEPLPNCYGSMYSRQNSRRLSVDDNDIAHESEAVKYFQNHLLKKEEKWVPIKCLAGHLSQANDSIRRIVGNSYQFTSFLYRNSHIFDIQGELVGLKDSATSVRLVSTLPNGKRRIKPGNVSSDSKSNKSDDTSNSDNAKSSYSSKKRFVKDNKNSQIFTNILFANGSKLLNGTSTTRNLVTVALAAIDYKTIMFLRNSIKELDEGNGDCSMSNLMGKIIKENCTNMTKVVGYTQIELDEYLHKHALFFDILDNEIVKACDISNVNIIIKDDCDIDGILSDNDGTLNSRKGIVYHVAKLWGIIDLGQHEHVFFDKSIFRNIDDLQKHFQTGERVYFNAILASKDSRAKWKATRVWKEVDNSLLQEAFSKSSDVNFIGPMLSDDINFSDDDLDDIFDKYNFDKSKKVDIPEKMIIDSEDENTMKSIISIRTEDDSISKTELNSSNAMRCNRNVNVETQTLSTGEIMAISFYQE